MLLEERWDEEIEKLEMRKFGGKGVRNLYVRRGVIIPCQKG